MADLALISEFPRARREDWLALVERVLKGASFDQRLVSTSYDGLDIEPLYERAADARPIAARIAGAPWKIVQRVDHPDPMAANAEALHDLENGATGLTILFAGAPSANGYGLLDTAPRTLDRALAGVSLDAIHLRLEAGARDLEAAKTFMALAGQRKVTLAKLDAALGLDPIGTLAQSGVLVESIAAALQRRAIFAADLSRRDYRGPAFIADGRPVHEAGGSEVQELAFALACAVAYLRALERAGLAVDAACRQIGCLLAADADQFLTLVKFRAVRKLWARVEEAAGLDLVPMRLHAETAWRMTTRRDPHVNWLRTTIAAFAAGLGGADSVTVLPYAAALGLPDRFARRIARNTQLILIEESNLHRVADPGAGSGAIENLTEQLCAAAWKLFQEIEAAGGAVAALEKGLIQKKIAVVRRKREPAVATRNDALTGTSEFPEIHETPVTVLDVPRPSAPKLKAALRIDLLPRIRLSEPFERLRDAADGAAAKGKRRVIFLANLGPISAFGERAAFAKNLFEAGGIAAAPNDGFPDLKDMVAAFRAAKAKLVCLASSDEVYGREALTAARALKQVGAARIYLAGKPGKRAAAWRQAGIDEFVYAGCDGLAALRRAHATLGLKPASKARARR